MKYCRNTAAFFLILKVFQTWNYSLRCATEVTVFSVKAKFKDSKSENSLKHGGCHYGCQLEIIYYPDNSLVPRLNRAQALLINMNRNEIHSDSEQLGQVPKLANINNLFSKKCKFLAFFRFFFTVFDPDSCQLWIQLHK